MAAGGGGDDLAKNLQGLSLKGNGDVAGKVLDDKFELTKLSAGDDGDGALYCIYLDKDTVSKDPKQLDGHYLLPRGFWGSEFKVNHPHPNDRLVISQSFMKIMSSLNAPIGRCLPYLQKWKVVPEKKEQLKESTPKEKAKEVKAVCIKDTWKSNSQSEKEGKPAVLQDEETSCSCKLCQYRNYLIRQKKHQKK